jgi:hypothetical protein
MIMATVGRTTLSSTDSMAAHGAYSGATFALGRPSRSRPIRPDRSSVWSARLAVSADLYRRFAATLYRW